MPKLLKYFDITKVDEAAHMVYGIATTEAVDSDNEICDYAAAKASFTKWAEESLRKTTAAGQDPSLGNIRVMHQLEVGGKAVKLDFDDVKKHVSLGTQPANDSVWALLKGGFLTSYSIGGDYDWQREEGKHVRYGPIIAEVSYVDRGSNPDAVFTHVKADGSMEIRKFQKPSTLKDRAALFLAKYASSTPDEKDLLAFMELVGKEADELAKAAAAAKGKENMTPEEIKALNDKLDSLKKGAKSVHEHLTALHALHKSHHDAMNAHHEKITGAIEKCMKAVGTDGEPDKAAVAELLKSFGDLSLAPAPVVNPPAVDLSKHITIEAAQKMVEDAVKKSTESLREELSKASLTSGDPTTRVKFTLVGRDGKEVTAGEIEKAAVAGDPFGGS